MRKIRRRREEGNSSSESEMEGYNGDQKVSDAQILKATLFYLKDEEQL